MSYLVLARKYRPQTFAEVVGQAHVTRPITNAINRGKLHHAFLFTGTRGTGKTTCARILAKALACERAPTAEPCNMCTVCSAVSAGTAADITEIDAASQNSVDDIRRLRDTVRYAPIQGKRKMYILDEVHMLSTAAFNAMLKVLEEPPSYAVFVFATTDPHKLPATILTRVQRYDFKLVSTSVLAEHLAEILTHENIEYEYDAVKAIAREGNGSVRDSLSLMDQVLVGLDGKLTSSAVALMIGAADRALVMGLTESIIKRDTKAILSHIDDANNRAYDMSLLARAVLAMVRDITVLMLGGGRYVDASKEEQKFMLALSDKANIPMNEIFLKVTAVTELVSRSPVQRHALEIGLVGVCL